MQQLNRFPLGHIYIQYCKYIYIWMQNMSKSVHCFAQYGNKHLAEQAVQSHKSDTTYCTKDSNVKLDLTYMYTTLAIAT